jgi:tetratricopeptide (TPR) repeat protein
MFGDYGETLVVDWGLAKQMAGVSGGEVVKEETSSHEILPPHDLTTSSPLTQAGQIMGTPAYMAPEQARGEVERLGPAADIYALGAILYTVLTGKPPYAGEVREVLAQVGQGLPPSAIRDTPQALTAICHKAMTKEPDARYATATELARDVERFLADEPVSAWEEPWALRARRWLRRHQALAATLTVTLFLVLAGTLAGLYLWAVAEQRQEAQAQEYRHNLRTAAEAQEQLGLAELRAGRFGSAASIFEKAAERTAPEPALAELHARLHHLQDQAKRLATFQKHGEQSLYLLNYFLLQEGVAELQTALDALRVFTHPEWWRHLPAELTPAQQERLREEIHLRLVILAGIHAYQDVPLVGKPSPSKAGCQRAVEIIRAAQRYRRTYAGDGVEILARTMLGERGLRLRADKPPTTANDFHLVGLLHVWIHWMPDDPVTRLALEQITGKELDLHTPLLTAERHLRRALSLDPENYWTYHWLGLALTLQAEQRDGLAAQQMIAAAELAYSACISLRPHSDEGYSMRAGAIVRQMKLAPTQEERQQLYQRGLDAMQQHLAVAPRSWRTFLARGELHKQMGQFPLALADYQHAITYGLAEQTRDPGFQACFAQRGEVYWATGRLEEALADFQEALRRYPQHLPTQMFNPASLYCHLGLIHYRQGKTAEAVADYTTAIRFQPHGLYFLARGIAYRRSQQQEQALADLEESLRRLHRDKTTKPDDLATVYQVRGLVHMDRQEHSLALQDYDAAIRNRPAGSYFYGRAKVRWALGQPEQTLADLQEALRRLPQEADTTPQLLAEVNSLCGHAEHARKRYAQAIADYSEAIWQFPVAEYYIHRAWSRLGLKQHSEAVADCTAALHLDPRHVRAFVVRGLAHVGTEEWAAAEADWQVVCQLDPQDFSAWYSVALLLRRRGDAAAIEHLAAALLAQHGQTDKPETAINTAWVLAHCGAQTASPEILLRLNEKGRAAPASAFVPLARGAAFYRASRLPEAVRELRTALPLQAKTSFPARPWPWLALAHLRQGHVLEGQYWLAQAQYRFTQEKARLTWYHRLETELLLREAAPFVVARP